MEETGMEGRRTDNRCQSTVVPEWNSEMAFGFPAASVVTAASRRVHAGSLRMFETRWIHGSVVRTSTEIAMPTRSLEAVDILEAIESKLAYIPGGRDREGRPLIMVNVPSELQPTTKPWLESSLSYLLTVFSEETKKNGLALIVDARHGAWRVARSCIRLSTILLDSLAASVIIVRPDGFWDKRVDSCTKSNKEGELTYVTLTKLQAYIEFSQLPYELGGTKAYDHFKWIQKRVVEERNIKTKRNKLYYYKWQLSQQHGFINFSVGL
ncbi:hypothetical protein KM043_013361 [Ampulex compressa]|nr:hypothetical protein KM043_013361 [Ampulex compressa]